MTDDEHYAQILKEAEPVEHKILSVLNHMAMSLEGIECELDHIKEALYANTPDA